MRKILKELSVFLLFVLVFFIISIFSCTLTNIKEIADDPDFNPKWDVDIRVPIVDYSESPITFESYVKGKALDSPEVSIPVLKVAWPIAYDPDEIEGHMLVENGIDIDDDSIDDFVIDGYYKTDPNTLEAQIWLTDNSNNNILEISSDCINIESITIEGTAINFGTPTSANNILIYTSTNFLDPANEYYLDLADSGAADQLDFSVDIELLNGSSPSYPSGDYTLNIKLAFNLGDDFGVVGEITNPGVLKSIPNKDIPLNDLPVDSITNFKLEFEYESNLSFGLNINNIFYGSDQTPSPDTFNTTIAPGVLSTSVMHGYQYVTSINDSMDEFQFNGNIIDYGDMSIDLELRLPAPTGDKIRLDTDTLIKFKVIASGESTISL